MYKVRKKDLGLILVLVIASMTLVYSLTGRSLRHTVQQSIAGTQPFPFDPAQVNELTLAKADPETSDHWMITLKRSEDLGEEEGKRKGREGKESEWKIQSEVSPTPFLDRRVNETFLFHLMDSMRRVRLEESPLKGPLESFGLEPPRFAIRWKAGNQSYQLLTGNPLGAASRVYVTIDGSTVWVGSGSAFRLLSLIDSIHTFRNKNWSTFEADDVDEIEFRHHGRSVLYAQREGNDWTDRRHRLVRKDAENLLTRITDIQAENLVDDPQKAVLLKTWVQNHPGFEVVLTDRFGQSVTLKVTQKEKVVYGLNSERPSAVFVLQPKIIQLFSSL